MELAYFSVEQSILLDDLVKSGDEYAAAIKTLVSWGAGERCAKDDKTDIEDALDILGVHPDGLVLHSFLDDMDEEEIRSWCAEYDEQYGIDWTDDDDIRQAWESVASEYNEKQLAKIAREEFQKRFEK